MRKLKEIIVFTLVYLLFGLAITILIMNNKSSGQITLNILGFSFLCIVSGKITNWLLKSK